MNELFGKFDLKDVAFALAVIALALTIFMLNMHKWGSRNSRTR